MKRICAKNQSKSGNHAGESSLQICRLVSLSLCVSGLLVLHAHCNYCRLRVSATTTLPDHHSAEAYLWDIESREWRRILIEEGD